MLTEELAKTPGERRRVRGMRGREDERGNGEDRKRRSQRQREDYMYKVTSVR